MQKIVVDAANWVNGRGYRKNQLVGAAELATTGTLVQLVEMAPDAVIPDHYHKTSREFYVVLGGQCRLFINEEPYLLQPGDMLLTEPGDVHRLVNEGHEPFTLLVFKTNATTADTYWVEDR